MNATAARCPQCASQRVHHHWLADMAHLTLIDQWKCLDTECGHRWDTTVTYAQLRGVDLPTSGPADGAEVSGRRG